MGVSQKASPESRNSRDHPEDAGPEGRPKEARLGVWVHVCVGAGVEVGSRGGAHPALSFPTLPPLNMLHGRDLEGLVLSPPGRNEKRRIVRRRSGCQARNQSSVAREEKGRVGGGWGRGPKCRRQEREGERPDGSRSQASGQQAGLGQLLLLGPTGVGPEGRSGGRRPGYLTQMHVLQERRRVRTSDCLLNPLECLHCALFFGPLVFPRTPLWAHVW